MKAAIVGLGLIGGSFALDLRKLGLVDKIIGVDLNAENAQKALELGIVDQIMSLDEVVKQADLIVLAIPVNALSNVLKLVLDQVNENQLVMDMGSTKSNVCKAVLDHPNRKNYVACHPIAGTEYSGPEAAFSGLYTGKVNIICDQGLSGEIQVKKALELFNALEMKTTFMSSDEHDKHIAYVSHLSHISSFSLGKTVLEIEESEKNIFNMAGSGFASTVRLAKSSPAMWAPIFEQNAENLSKALGAYIDNLIQFKNWIDQQQTDEIHQYIEDVNDIKRVLNGIKLNN
tara:strand:- start:19666 stop:20526 length:861 start_codon:yes stop_codon:yes gene_type:complete